jgi:hypothetical protein
MQYQPTCIAVIDIGSPANQTLGWYLLAEQLRCGGSLIEELITKLVPHLQRGPCALGFEAPMYIPYRSKPNELTRGRTIEGNRPWSAGAGAAVLATALAVVPFVLRSLRDAAPGLNVHFDCQALTQKAGELFLFEALVTGNAKGNDHQDDARIAAEAFQAACAQWPPKIEDTSVFNLLGASLLRTGWSADPALLSRSCLVIKP